MKQGLMILAIGVLMLLLIAALVLPKRRRGRLKGPSPLARAPLSVREQPMFFRLQEAFPEHIVLAQVAFSALLTTKSTTTRNTFARKVADFVLCSRGFVVIAVVELDDSTHRGRETQDVERQALLERAGYRVLRFRHVPDAVDLRAAISKRPQAEGIHEKITQATGL